MLLTDTTLEGAALFAERLRKAIEELDILHEQHSLGCTVSIGVACTHSGMSSYQMLIEEADKALYQAKSAGRNHVTLSTGSLATQPTPTSLNQPS